MVIGAPASPHIKISGQDGGHDCTKESSWNIVVVVPIHDVWQVTVAHIATWDCTARNFAKECVLLFLEAKECAEPLTEFDTTFHVFLL